MSLNKEEQARYYDLRFSSFEYANRLQLERATSILEALRKADLAKPRILDFGCGPGWLSNILNTFGPTVGIDLSPEAIKEAKKQYPGVSFEAVDVFQWNFPRGAFDVVVSQEVLEHVDDQPRYLGMAADLLTDRGFLILTTPNAPSMMAMPEKERIAWSNQPIENWVTMSELRALLARNFELLEMKTITFGIGSLGSYQLVNSTKLYNTLARLGLGGSFDRFRSGLGYGLHTVALARKR